MAEKQSLGNLPPAFAPKQPGGKSSIKTKVDGDTPPTAKGVKMNFINKDPKQVKRIKSGIQAAAARRSSKPS